MVGSVSEQYRNAWLWQVAWMDENSYNRGKAARQEGTEENCELFLWMQNLWVWRIHLAEVVICFSIRQRRRDQWGDGTTRQSVVTWLFLIDTRLSEMIWFRPRLLTSFSSFLFSLSLSLLGLVSNASLGFFLPLYTLYCVVGPWRLVYICILVCIMVCVCLFHCHCEPLLGVARGRQEGV